jgi:hypothetical protein
MTRTFWIFFIGILNLFRISDFGFRISDPSEPPAGAPETGNEGTGLPWPRSWPGVYALVVACFVTYVVLLVVLKQAFS